MSTLPISEITSFRPRPWYLMASSRPSKWLHPNQVGHIGSSMLTYVCISSNHWLIKTNDKFSRPRIIMKGPLGHTCGRNDYQRCWRTVFQCVGGRRAKFLPMSPTRRFIKTLRNECQNRQRFSHTHLVCENTASSFWLLNPSLTVSNCVTIPSIISITGSLFVDEELTIQHHPGRLSKGR